MISKYGQTFASMAEVRRFEQVKPETARLWEAFETMREALIVADKTLTVAVSANVGLPNFDPTEHVVINQIRAALALADKVLATK